MSEEFEVTFTKWLSCLNKPPIRPGVYQVRHNDYPETTYWLAFTEGTWRHGILASLPHGLAFNKSPSYSVARKGRPFPEHVTKKWQWRGQDGNLHPEK